MSDRFADVSGGSIFNIGLLAINDTVFSENTAMDYGLAVMNEEPALDMSNVTFHDNMLSCLPDEYSDFDDVSEDSCFSCSVSFRLTVHVAAHTK